MKCNHCGTVNDPSYRFCMKCGKTLTAPAPEDQTVVAEEPLDGATIVATPQELSQAHIQKQPDPSPPPPQQPAYTPPKPQLNAQKQPSAAQVGQAALQFGKQSISAVNIWGPFAGYGTRRKHIGWLMDNRGDRANDLINKVNAKFKDREIPGVEVRPQSLVAKGVIVENRPYFILKRGLVSQGLHIGKFGKDLFISIVSYLKPPISHFRVILLVLMVLFGLYMVYGFSTSLAESASDLVNSLTPSLFGSRGSSGGSNLLPLLCIIGPVGTINNIALFLFVIYSTYKWLTERDFWAGLRIPPNEFNEDDLMAMEKAVEQTVRMSIDEIGLDPDDLRPTTAFDRRVF